MRERIKDLIEIHKGKIPMFLIAAVVSVIGGKEILTSLIRGGTLSDEEAVNVIDVVRALKS